MHKVTYMANYNFAEDFPIAEKTEAQVADFLVNEIGMEFIEGCNDNRYDLVMKTPNGKRITVEVKEDFTCKETGNVGVEYECRGKNSGIRVSKADFYLYKVHRPDGKIQLLVQKTDKLKDMIRKRSFHRKVVGGDVGSNSKNYLFELGVFQEGFLNLGLVDE